MASWFGKGTPEGGAPKWPAPASRGARPGEKVKVTPLLSERTVVFASPGQRKEDLLDRLVGVLAAERSLADPKVLLAKVMEREQGISTTLDSGLSLPHARIDGLPGIVAALCVAPAGVPDPKQEGLAIRVMFLFFSPNRPESFPVHLQLLRGVAALLQPPVIEGLCRTSTPAAVLELLRAQEG